MKLLSRLFAPLLFMFITLGVVGQAHALRDCRLKVYSLAATLTSANDNDCTIAYAVDTDVFYVRAAGSWTLLSSFASMTNGAAWSNAVDGTTTLTEGGETEQHVVTNNLITLTSGSSATYAFTPALALADSLTLSDGLVIDQSANNVVSFTENGEDVTLTFASNSATWASTTSATFTFTPAVGITGILTLSDALTLSDGLTIDQSANNVLTIAENSENLEVTFAGNAATVSSTTGLAELNFTSIGVESEIVATHLETIRFCGNGSPTGVAHYMGPVLLDDTEADLVFGGAGCDALDSATETTADAPWHAAFAFKPVAMVCVGKCTGASAANDAITYQLRDDAASVTGMTCTAGAWGGDATPSQCTVRDPTPETVAANSAVSVLFTGTDDACDAGGDDFECLLYVTF